MAMGSPSQNLTPMSRPLNYSMKDWHRTTDHEFDLQLDILWRGDSSPGNCQNQVLSMETSSQIDNMHNSATDKQLSHSNTGTRDQTPVPVAADETLSHAVNDFDNPDFHAPESHTGDHNSIAIDQSAIDQSISGSSVEGQVGSAASTELNPAIYPAKHASQSNTQDLHNGHLMQRGLTDSHIPSSMNCNFSHGLPAVNNAYYQANNMLDDFHNSYQKTSNVTINSHQRQRAQTTGLHPGSYYTQQHAPYVGSNQSQPMHTNGIWSAGMGAYAPTQAINGSAYQSQCPTSRNSLGSTASRSSNSHVSQVSSFPNNIHANVLAANHLRSIDNSRLASGYAHHHNNNKQVVNPVDLQSHSLQHNAYLAVPNSKVLKSQSPFSSDGAGSTTMSSKRKSRNASSQRRQRIEMVEEDEEDEEEIDVSGNGEPETNYPSIEAARLAERPKFRTNHQKDDTIPRTEKDMQFMIVRMVRCMRSVRHAEDNEGMIKQWEKLKQDGPRVEQAAWRILDLVLQLHVDGIPLLPNKPSCNRYGKMADRWNAICDGLRRQKTMCKHLLGADFTAQLVNDPATASTRVQNNRKVNAGKKTVLDKGRRVSYNEDTRKGRQDSFGSLDQETFLEDLGDEDAEGEIDEDYLLVSGGMNNSHRATTQSTPSRSSVPAHGLKHEQGDEDSDYIDTRGKKKSRRATTGTRRIPTNGIAKNQRAPPGSRSRYQAINGRMVDLKDKSQEARIYAEASPEIQARFNAYHYPDGRPSESNHSRRSSRAAAPTTFRGADNSEDMEMEDSGSPYEGTDDDFHQEAHHPQ